MNWNRYLLLLLVSCVFFTCESDNPAGPDVLSYDGPNDTSPIRPDGRHEFAAQFTSATTQQYQGRFLESVRYFVTEEAAELIVKVYDAGSVSSPGMLLYEADLTRSQVAGRYNEHRLTDPIEITGADLWISVSVDLAGVQQSIGCDAEGSGRGGGDWLFFEGDGQWLTFRQRTNGQARVNWNIQGVLSSE